MIYKIFYGLLFTVCIASNLGCKKFLETKSDQRLSTPQTLDDLQALLDNPSLTRSTGINHTGADEYYLYYSDWEVYDEVTQEAYVWNPDLNDLEDWRDQYITVFYANTVLFNLNNYPISGAEDIKQRLRGTALFYRAYSHYQVAQLYATQYDKATAGSELGIPLRLSADFNEKSTRPTLQQTYDQIIADINNAFTLLPNITVSKSQPTRTACYAFLARVYLQMGDYQKAKENADACLQLTNSLTDFNSLIASDAYPLGDFKNNPEIIYYSRTDAPVTANDARAKVDSNLYNSFGTTDLRKDIFFRDNGDGTYAFKGNYSGGYDLFGGLATDEMYLIRAESNARLGNKDAAMQDLNTVLVKRHSSSFIPFTAGTADEALSIVLEERKKELIYRGTRWSDLKRLNKEPGLAATLTRDFTIGNGQIYTLPPNDLKYVLLIPETVMNVSELQQNPR